MKIRIYPAKKDVLEYLDAQIGSVEERIVECNAELSSAKPTHKHELLTTLKFLTLEKQEMGVRRKLVCSHIGSEVHLEIEV